MRLILRTLSLLALLVAPATGAYAQAAATGKPLPSAMLIFDGSGSMWGKLEGEKKIKLEQARDAVRASLGKIAPQSSQFGLMSFGHRRASDCSDVQVLVPPEPSTAPAFTDRLMNPLEKLSPRGKGPLTAALREAAKVLGKLPGPRAIVLVHDDPDNCQADPCDELADFQKSAPGVVISVVGLGIKETEATRYECLTKPTGGRLFNAQDGAGIANGIDAAIQLAALAGKPAATAAARPAVIAPAPVLISASEAAVAKPVVLVRDGAPALRLRALQSKDRLPFGHRVHWIITSAGSANDAPPLAEADGIDAIVPLTAATYRVRAASGLVTAETTVTLGAQGQTLGEVNFEAGEIRIPQPLPGDAMLVVSERDRDSTLKPGAPLPPIAGRRIGLWPHGITNVLVPARPIWLQLEQGALRSQWPVAMNAGEVRGLDIALPGGRILVSLAAAAGPPIAGTGSFPNHAVVFTLEEDDPDAPRGRREIARSAGAAPEFVVPPGVYMIAATRGSLETRERISVAAGETVQRALPLMAARLVLSARLGTASPTGSANPAASGAADSFRLTRLDTEADTTQIIAGTSPIIDVPPGRYRIEARRNNAAIKAEQVIEIRAGQYLPVTLEYQAGELRLEVRQRSDAAGDLIGWRVLDAAGHLVWSGDEAPASTLLQAGPYTVRAVLQGQRRDQPVEIRTGLVSTVRLAP